MRMVNEFNWNFKIICENLREGPIQNKRNKQKPTTNILILSSQSFYCYSGVRSKHSKCMNQTTRPKTFIKIGVFTTYEMLV